MMDKSHCFMNAIDEHEYTQFYDFTKAYTGYPNEIKQEVLKKENEEGNKE